MKKYHIPRIKNIVGFIVLSALGCCNDAFLEKVPVVSQSEATAFKTYDNFLTYSWGLYNIFQDVNHIQTLGDRAISFNGTGDLLAGYLTSAADNDTDDSRRAGTITVPSSGGGWDYSFIRRVNIMLQNIDKSDLTTAEKEHWRSVGYFFFAYRYAELISRFGDVYWVDHILKEGDDDEIIYGPRTPRKVVADSILARLQYAETHIREAGEGANTNTINKAVVQALLSRFTLFEGTWRRYHDLGDEEKYLNECVRVSKELRATCPAVDNNYDGLLTSNDLGGRTGVILYKQYSTALEMGSVSQRYERSTSTYFGFHRATADLYLVKSNGLPVTNTVNADRPDIDMYDEFRDRDPRLLLTVAPPYSQPYRLINKNAGNDYPFPDFTNSDGTLQYNTSANYARPGQDPQEFVDLLATAILPNNPQSKRLPAFQFQGTAMIWSVPNFPSSPATQFRSKSGYICWRNYALWDVVTMVNGDNQANADKPVFFIEEILLNEAEASFETGQFTQEIADATINKLRRRTTVNMPDFVIANIDVYTDPYNPNDKVTPGRDPDVAPVLWEIRRERIVELMGLGYGFADIRRWKKGPWFVNRPILGAKIDKQYYKNLSNTGAPTNVTPAWVNNLPLVNKDFSPATTHGYIRRFDDPSKDGKGWDDAFYLFPIPKNDLTLNSKLTQNQGWEKY
jgi:hypothetical protein